MCHGKSGRGGSGAAARARQALHSHESSLQHFVQMCSPDLHSTLMLHGCTCPSSHSIHSKCEPVTRNLPTDRFSQAQHEHSLTPPSPTLFLYLSHCGIRCRGGRVRFNPWTPLPMRRQSVENPSKHHRKNTDKKTAASNAAADAPEFQCA